MFRRLQDRLTAAVSAAGFGTESDVSRLTALTSLGYSMEEAENALRSCNGNVDRAAEFLLESRNGLPVQTFSDREPVRMDMETDEENALQKAIEQSLQQEQPQLIPCPPPPQRTPIMNMAAEAAARRAELNSQRNKPIQSKKTGMDTVPAINRASTTKETWNKTRNRTKPATIPSPTIQLTSSDKLRQHHPAVQLVPKLTDKTVEERLLRTADRMKAFPQAVDTLYRALLALQKNPESDKYRKIDMSSPGYQHRVAPALGASDFLATIGFQKHTPTLLFIPLPLFDPALIYLGISVLEKAQQSSEYLTAKIELEFAQEMDRLLAIDTTSSMDQQQRNRWKAQLPPEPDTGRGAILQVELGATKHCTLRRRWDADDTLEDVLQWLGVSVGTVLVQKLRQQTWILMDQNQHPAMVLDVSSCGKHTLQHLGCWPSGRLQIRPAQLQYNPRIVYDP